MNLCNWLSRKRYPYEPLIRVEITRERVIHNFREFLKLAPQDSNGHTQIAPVLKSNAYGHGLIEVAGILRDMPGDIRAHIPFCIVDSYFEAITLRSRGFTLPLLIIGYTRPEIILRSRLKNTAFTLTSLDTLRTIFNSSRSTHF
jgi:alanine racemase